MDPADLADGRPEGHVVTGHLERDFPSVICSLATAAARETLTTSLPGAYNYRNLLAAAAVASYYKVPLASIAAAAQDYRPGGSRSEERLLDGSPVLFDAYNANPDSLAAALRWLASRPEPRKVAVLGELLEQGAYAKTAHTEAARGALAIEGCEVALFGDAYGDIGLAPGGETRTTNFTDVDALAAWLSERTGDAGTVVLIKGSRGNRLERLLA